MCEGRFINAYPSEIRLPRALENLIMALNESATSLVKFATTLAEDKDLQAQAESCYISYR